MITVQNVYKQFEGHEVLTGISTEMRDGQCNMIIGQSGSGKTVLMKSIIGLHTIDRGDIQYDGRSLPRMSQKELRMLRREVGMLFQGAALFDEVKERYFAGQPTFCERSWGMSHDWHIAISEGSTMVRIGTTIFGPRVY